MDRKEREDDHETRTRIRDRSVEVAKKMIVNSEMRLNFKLREVARRARMHMSFI